MARKRKRSKPTKKKIKIPKPPAIVKFKPKSSPRLSRPFITAIIPAGCLRFVTAGSPSTPVPGSHPAVKPILSSTPRTLLDLLPELVDMIAGFLVAMRQHASLAAFYVVCKRIQAAVNDRRLYETLIWTIWGTFKDNRMVLRRLLRSRRGASLRYLVIIAREEDLPSREQMMLYVRKCRTTVKSVAIYHYQPDSPRLAGTAVLYTLPAFDWSSTKDLTNAIQSLKELRCFRGPGPQERMFRWGEHPMALKMLVDPTSEDGDLHDRVGKDESSDSQVVSPYDPIRTNGYATLLSKYSLGVRRRCWQVRLSNRRALAMLGAKMGDLVLPIG